MNTAPACGVRGLVVLGFPSNDFGGQEPGSEEQIRSCCDTRYQVSFPMFEKDATKGAQHSEIHSFLTRAHGEPAWNFQAAIETALAHDARA